MSNELKIKGMVDMLVMFEQVMSTPAIEGKRANLKKFLEEHHCKEANFSNRYNMTSNIVSFFQSNDVELFELLNLEVEEIENQFRKRGSQFEQGLSQVLAKFGNNSVTKMRIELLFAFNELVNQKEEIGGVAQELFSKVSIFNIPNKLDGTFLMFRMSYAYPKYAICSMITMTQVSEQHYSLIEKRRVCDATRSNEPSNKDFNTFTNKGFLYKNVTNYCGVLLNNRIENHKTIENFYLSENNIKNSHIYNGHYVAHTDMDNLIFTTPFFMVRVNDADEDAIENMLKYYSLKEADFESIEELVKPINDEKGIRYFLSTFLVPHLAEHHVGSMIPSKPNSFDIGLFEFYATGSYESLASGIASQLIPNKRNLKNFIEELNKYT